MAVPGPFDDPDGVLVGFVQRFIGPEMFVVALGTVTVFVRHEKTMSALKTGFACFFETASVKKFTAASHHVRTHPIDS